MAIGRTYGLFRTVARLDSRADPAPTLDKEVVWALLAVLALACLPHLPRLPAWVSLIAAILLIWRGSLAWRSAALPGKWLLIALALVAVAAAFIEFGPLFGRDASVSLLSLMLALKVLELRTSRDAVVLICLGYFQLTTHFLYSQSIPTALYGLMVAIGLTMVMVRLQDRRGTLRWAGLLHISASLLAQGAPLMLVLFVLFPRVQGPIFGFPQATSTGVSGLSDSMAPGSLAALGLSDAVAFRAEFESEVPKTATLYWRGPVLWDFDGRTWTLGDGATFARPRHETLSTPLRYTITLEPHYMRWAFALDLPQSAPAGTVLTGDYQLLTLRPVRNRLRYVLTSHSAYRYGADERPEQLARALRLPKEFNPQARQLAAQLRQRARDDRQVIGQTLNVFRTQRFFYTLVPPELGRHSVDEFLFQTRRGFCEHYASAFVFLMRAAGVPARVVTGYQGGEINPLGGYLIVRQSEAHAWAEVWLKDEGWVRIDPTAAVSPARIDIGIAAAMPADEPLPIMVRGDLQLLKGLRLGLDAMANSWNQWILGYSPERQRQLLRRVGVSSAHWLDLALLLASVAAIVLGALGWIALRKLRWQARDPVRRTWREFCRKLERAGIGREPCEGPLDFSARVASVRPQLAEPVRRIARDYVALRYAGCSDLHAQRALRQQVRAFRP